MSNNYYINKKAFYKDLKFYLIAKEENPALPIPPIIIDYLTKLGKKYLTDHKFWMYNNSMKQQMFSEGMFSAIRYIDKFKYKIYDDPFSYFTSFFRNGFFKVINDEKKNKKIKGLMIDDYLHNSIYNYKLKEYSDSNYDNVVIGNENKINNPEFAPMKVIKPNGDVQVIETETEWVKDTYKKLNKKYDVENLPKYKKFNKVIKKYNVMTNN